MYVSHIGESNRYFLGRVNNALDMSSHTINLILGSFCLICLIWTLPLIGITSVTLPRLITNKILSSHSPVLFNKLINFSHQNVFKSLHCYHQLGRNTGEDIDSVNMFNLCILQKSGHRETTEYWSVFPNWILSTE